MTRGMGHSGRILLSTEGQLDELLQVLISQIQDDSNCFCILHDIDNLCNCTKYNRKVAELNANKL